ERVLLLERSVQRQLERDDRDAERDDERASLRGETARDVHRLTRLLAVHDRGEHVPELDRGGGHEERRRLDRLARRGLDETPPIDGVADEAGEDPPQADPPRTGILDDDDDE